MSSPRATTLSPDDETVDTKSPDYKRGRPEIVARARRELVGGAIADAALKHFPKGKCPVSNDRDVLEADVTNALPGVDVAVWNHDLFDFTNESDIRDKLWPFFCKKLEPSLPAALRADDAFDSVAVAAIAKAISDHNVGQLGLRGVVAHQLFKSVNHMTIVATDGSKWWKNEERRHAPHRELNVISTAHMTTLVNTVAMAKTSVALFTGPSGVGKSFALMLLAYSRVPGHVTCVVYFLGSDSFANEFNQAVSQQLAMPNVDGRVAECRALYWLFAARAAALPAKHARGTDTIVFAIDEAGGRPELLRAFCRAASERFTLSATDTDAKALGAHLSALLNGAKIRFVAAGTGIGATSSAKAGSHPKSYTCVSIEVPRLFKDLMSVTSEEGAITTRFVPDRILMLLQVHKWPTSQPMPTTSEAREAAQLVALVRNSRCAIIAAVELAKLFPKPDPIVPPECAVLLSHLQRVVALRYKALNGLNDLSSDEYVTAVTLAIAAAVSDQVEPTRHVAAKSKLPGNAHDAQEYLPMMLTDNATSNTSDDAVEIEGSEKNGTGGPLYLPSSLRGCDNVAAFDGRLYEARHTLQAAQAIIATAVCDGRPSHTQSANGLEAALVDACLRLARLMMCGTARAMLRSAVPDRGPVPTEPLPFVTLDRFVRILASRLDDVAVKPVRMAQLPHQFSKDTPFGLPKTAMEGIVNSTGFTTQSFRALMHVARGNLRANNAGKLNVSVSELDALMKDDGVFDSHYVLKNAPQAPSADLIVILQGARPGKFTVIFVQSKLASSDKTAKHNASKAAIEGELAKTLVERDRTGTAPPPAAAAAADGNDTVEPYYAIVQHCLKPEHDNAFRGQLTVLDHIVRSGGVHAQYATSGVWLVSASEPSPLLPGLCNSADTVPGAEYVGCDVSLNEQPSAP